MEIIMKAEEKRRQKDEDMHDLREQKNLYKELKKYIEIEELANNKAQHDYIISQRIIAGEKRKALNLEKKYRIKEQLERKIAETEETIQMAQDKIQQIDKEEIEIMKKHTFISELRNDMLYKYEKIINNKDIYNNEINNNKITNNEILNNEINKKEIPKIKRNK